MSGLITLCGMEFFYQIEGNVISLESFDNQLFFELISTYGTPTLCGSGNPSSEFFFKYNEDEILRSINERIGF